MEHRCSVRKPLQFQLLLYKHSLPVQSAICHNLGLGGMFISATGYQWRKNEILEVEFVGPENQPRMRLPAVVVHYGKQGAGLMFGSMTGEQRRRLRMWLFKGPADDLAVSVPADQSTREVA
ncbi:MAG: PilZ domain-containing protein [Thiogranum sp.]|nr:PilZ domain-containing protein [Thiogranum sp.]